MKNSSFCNLLLFVIACGLSFGEISELQRGQEDKSEGGGTLVRRKLPYECDRFGGKKGT
eukprot:CAMPEP_0194157698 /NCGR_PEP_ID=MMETSP0152-20130528/73023_1 /TAXON_ID=1049557 /ORGANISM="Thalassiothrix antarctica, Strain L6-D1" /LENGTH=58 /DNA_ID=CAMNT_0038866299 /DNA_START=13 /DNA_END=185 /DNA_ORIENTATION=+